jgi:uncharacterized membrane protein (DUF485 family)
MDDKELIKRIMEEVKDEKLRKELLRRVAKGEGSSVEKILKRIEHRLKAQDSLAKQEIMHGRTEKIAKIDWWGELIAFALFFVVPPGIMFFLMNYGIESLTKIPTWVFVVIAVVSLAAAFVIQAYYLLEGKKEYERRKKEEEEIEK